MKDFRQLKIWKKAHLLVLSLYEATGSYPDSERYSSTSQIRRSAASIPANIAEGCEKEGDADFARYVQITAGSASELEYHLLLSHDLGLMQKTVYDQLNNKVTEIKRMISSLLKKLRAES
jgi:four helix bundle protein